MELEGSLDTQGDMVPPSTASLDMSVTSSSNWKKLIVETISNNYDLQKDFILNHYDVYLKLIGYYMSIILQKKR